MEFIRAVLQSHGDSVSIHATHEEAKQTPHGQELLEGVTVDSGDLQHAQHNHVDHHGPFSAELVTSQAKTRRSDASQ